MANLGRVDEAGRAIAGLLTYNPGPGIYSRLERAIEAMPENVRVQERPGLLKRYKDGVPGWELKATDLDSIIAGRDVVPKSELLARVKERSPVYTHGEVILGGRPQVQHVPTGGTASRYDADTDTLVRLPDDTRPVPDYQFPDTGEVSRLGQGVSHGPPRYEQYGQGGQDYAELLLTQPGAERLLAHPDAGTDPEFQVAPRVNYGSHWSDDTKDAVAHARFDTHGDALRINELQSDLGIHNRKAREATANSPTVPERRPNEPLGAYEERLRANGFEIEWDRDGGMKVSSPDRSLPFPLEDTWADLLIKRLALEAARKGHRAIEIASPRAIADKVGGNIENYEHFYGKVVPGALERLGRKMGGLVDDTRPVIDGSTYRNQVRSEVGELDADARMRLPPDVHPHYRQLSRAIADNLFPETIMSEAQNLARSLEDSGRPSANLMPGLMRLAERDAAAMNAWENLRELEPLAPPALPAGRRYLMSDEMRRRLIESGVGASVLAPLLMQEGE